MVSAAGSRAPRLDERVADFVKLYEARAFLVYNVALRITCEAKPATAAAEAAFVGQAAHGASEATLLPALVVSALGHAKRKPKPNGAGDAEMRLMRVDAELPPTERAALALSQLADMDTSEIAALLHVDPAAGAQLLDRAMEAFALGAGVPPDSFAACYADWGWADPPAELWERVYPSFRRALERPAVAQAAADQLTQVLPAAVAGPASPKRRPRVGKPALVAAVLALLAGGGAFAYTHRGGAEHVPTVRETYGGAAATPAQPSEPTHANLPPASATGKDDPVAAVQSKPHKPLTAAELDGLRLKEVAMLRTYEKRQADKRLSQSQRDYAARKVAALQDLARQRLEVRRHERALAKRERALAREELAAERRRQNGGADTQKQPATEDQPYQAPKQQQTSTTPSDSAPTQQEAQQECIEDQDSGQYICPQ